MKITKITSLEHPSVKHFIKLGKNHHYREEHRSVVIEGKKLINEVSKPCPIKTLMVLHEMLIPEDVECDEAFVITDSILKKIAGSVTPEGILAEVSMPEFHSLEGKKYLIALDRVQDPGNLGTLLRTALALGWKGVFLLPDCCDPYNDKALRAARGATFRLPMRKGSWDELLILMKKEGTQPFVADLDGVPLDTVEIGERGAVLVMSNEASGVSPIAAKVCRKVTIPMPGDMESLNVSVAGGILMYQLRRVL